MAEPPPPNSPKPTPDIPAPERDATTNRAAFLHWLLAVHGIALAPGDSALRAWAEADPPTATALVIHFAGAGFASARLAAGLLLQADLRPDDRILVLGPDPDWLPQALGATRGRAATPGEATVLVADHRPRTLPPKLRRAILLSGATLSLPPEITVSRPEDWTYPSESSAD
jgi:hypothetical protein